MSGTSGNGVVGTRNSKFDRSTAAKAKKAKAPRRKK